MNAIISLCHFCEIHGPRILFCTQAFHQQSVIGGLSEQAAENVGLVLETKNSEASGKDIAGDDEKNKNESSDQEGKNAKEAKTAGLSACKPEAKCEACRSLPPSLPGYVSNDPEARMRYVSTQHPSHPQIFSMVRQACVRSLSSEVSPPREGPGPIFFGDDSGGYVLSHVFIVKDRQYARGFQRRYSIIVVMMDKIFLLNSWLFLVQHMKEIIEEVQAKALKVYESEQAKSPARTHRGNICGGGIVGSRGGPTTPGKPSRSLVELTGDKHIFRKLHQTFTWLLKAGGNRLTEKLLEGPPTEDSIIDIENQAETEEGFVLVESKKSVVEDDFEDLFCEEATCLNGEEPDEESQGEEDVGPVFRNLRHLLKVFGYSKFHKVAHHVAIGNQIIIRGQGRKLIESVINCLMILLPKGCCRVIYFSRRYEESWKCNFLGLATSAQIPKQVEPYVVVDIHVPERPAVGCHGDVQDAVSSLGLGDPLFNGYVFTVESPMHLPEKGPTILNKMEYVLLNDNLADSVVEQYIISLKEEWMNKVKVLYKFTRAGGNRSEEDNQGLLRIVGADEDKLLLKFWREGLSDQYKRHMRTSNCQQATKS